MISSQLYVGVGKKLRFTRWNFYETLENNEVSGKLRANHFLILITFLCPVKLFITIKQTLIKDIIKEWNSCWFDS